MSKNEILKAVELYAKSIDNADDISQAEKVWLPDGSATMIHPLGMEKGWENIKNNFYRGVMAERFSSRKLRVVNEPDIKEYGDFAIVIFDWQFNSIVKKDLSERITKGRESQVYINKDGRWKLLHVHYSRLE